MIYCLQEDNGSGKTVFFDTVFYNNSNKVTYFTNDTVLNPELYVKELIDIFGVDQKSFLYELLNIENLYNKKTSVLSSGETQAVKLCILFSKPKQNIILDEPTSFMDEKKRYKLYEYINSVKDKSNIIVTLHSSSELLMLSEQIYSLNEVKELYEKNTLLK